MKSSIAFCVLFVAAASAPAWSQDDRGAFGDNPYHPRASTGELRADQPFDPDRMTKRYRPYGERFREPYDLNPYDGDAPTGYDDGHDRAGGEADPYGLANPDDPDARSRPDGGSVGTYGRPPDPGRRAASDLLKHYDQFGHYNDGLTTYPYDPCAVVTPYEPDGGPCGGGAQPMDTDNPYRHHSVDNPYAPGAPGNYGQNGQYGGTGSNPYGPYGPPRGDRSFDNPYAPPYAPGATGNNGRYGLNAGTASNPYDPNNSYPGSGEPLGGAPAAPSGAGAATSPAGQPAPSDAGSDPSLKADLDSLNRQLDQAEADLRAASGPRPPDRMGGDDKGPGAASAARDRPNSKPRNGNSHRGRAASKAKTPDQLGVYNGRSNPQTAVDPVAQGVHSSGSGGLGKRPEDSGSDPNQTNP